MKVQKWLQILFILLLPAPSYASKLTHYSNGNISVEYDIYSNKHSNQILIRDFNKALFQQKLDKNEVLIDVIIFKYKIALIFERNNTHHVMVINASTGELIDNFWAYHVSVSLNNKYLIYTKWTARGEQSQFGNPTGTTAYYDLAKPPLENRTKLEQHLFKSATNINKALYEKVGIPVYPLGDYNQTNYGWGDVKKDSTRLKGKYNWYDEDSVIFAVKAGANRIKLVDVQNISEKEKLKIRIYVIDNQHFRLNLPTHLNIIKITKRGQSVTLFTPNNKLTINDISQWIKK